ncbi:AAA family ATPase [Nonomuraea zeae]|uniref:MoxR family ATPase n=1 Tax=Nonomuraea zeae TaxID=1642303 RepID=A0A5S4FNS6_9ACTN|nr:MoxR family ATPase [Nonomuraea zeae]TMR22326.1 MoxR family ATPase [Nonomuraea zeae]
MAREVLISDTVIELAEPARIPERTFVGRAEELQMCRVAWGVRPDGTDFIDSDVPPLSFRLEGAPGLGKNEIVYEIARRLGLPLYIIQGHEELTPEDLVLLLTPNPKAEYSDSVPALTLRASPLSTALYTGGLFFFDEINRVPERALSPLASVLDGRQYIYSAMAGINIGPPNQEARKSFRFCCALNPSLSNAGHVLPEYIEQRTLPVIEIDHPPFEDLHQIIQASLDPSPDFLSAFTEWYQQEERADVSVRQAIALMNYAMSYEQQVGGAKLGVLQKVSSFILGRKS